MFLKMIHTSPLYGSNESYSHEIKIVSTLYVQLYIVNILLIFKIDLVSHNLCYAITYSIINVYYKTHRWTHDQHHAG